MKKTIKRSKSLLTLAIAAVLILSLAIFAACDISGKKPSDKDTAAAKAERQRVYAFSAISGATLLSNMNNGGAPLAFAGEEADPLPQTRPDGIGDDDAARIKDYIQMFEGYILNNGIAPVVTAPTEEDGEYAKYEVKMTVTLPNAQGGTDTFVMYYTEKNIVTETENGEVAKADGEAAPETTEGEAAPNGEDDEDEGKESGTETETTSDLEGVIIMDGNAYPVVGNKEVEEEEGEREEELSFKIFLSETDKDDYILIEQEIEQDEVEYVYTVFKAGKMVTKTSVEFENDAEDNEQEIKISFLDKTGQSAVKNTYKIENGEDNGHTFSVKYKNGNETVKFDVDVNEGVYTFIYRNGFTESL